VKLASVASLRIIRRIRLIGPIDKKDSIHLKNNSVFRCPAELTRKPLAEQLLLIPKSVSFGFSIHIAVFIYWNYSPIWPYK
jgi:hypothetical protein